MNIEGAICRLRALEPQDIDVMYGWENDTDLWRVSGTMAPFSRHSLMRFIEEQQYDIYALRQQRLVIEADVDGEARAVGAIDLFDFDPQNLRAGVGVVISAEYRERGYAKDALNILKHYAKVVLHLHQLWCGIGADNKASIRLFQGAGCVECGRRREWILTSKGSIDEILMQKILR
ncbi:MAG: GNAT family N-acetyltransferase [Alistipes sp.]|nr:GNAT family N-acetyltransferase [Alistipes sp.]